MNILFYAPFYNRSRDTESLMLESVKKGNNVFLLTLFENGPIVQFLKDKNVKVYSLSRQKFKVGFLNIIYHCYFLIRFCYSNKINIVFSHLEFTNFIAILSQYFINAKVIINRHHVDELHLLGHHKSISYYITYHLSKKTIVVSNRAKQFMIDVEKVNPRSIDVVPLLYDFNLYDSINLEKVAKIKKDYQSDILLVLACRLVEDKRPELSIEVVNELLLKGLNVKLLILGEGDLFDVLKSKIETMGLNNNAFLLGRKPDVLNYLSACDFLIHPSLLDSSSVIIKEAGLVKLPPIVCENVGDVNDYLINNVNAFIVSKENFVNECVNVILNKNDQINKNVGENLNKVVYQRFSINHQFSYYEKLMSF